jgi:hypothetical protein
MFRPGVFCDALVCLKEFVVNPFSVAAVSKAVIFLILSPSKRDLCGGFFFEIGEGASRHQFLALLCISFFQISASAQQIVPATQDSRTSNGKWMKVFHGNEAARPHCHRSKATDPKLFKLRSRTPMRRPAA